MELRAYDQIPLRILTTNKCNGRCYFCHNEGVSQLYEKNITLDIFKQAIAAARKYQIRKIVLSGGEPTLSMNVEFMLHYVKENYPDVMLSMTTNGANLALLLKSDLNFDKINLSVSSFDRNVYSKYQRVEPLAILNMLYDRKINASVNIVVTKDNYKELNNIIDFCIKKNLSIEILFELRSYDLQEINGQLSLIKEIEDRYGYFFLKIDNIPSLKNNLCGKSSINIKHPYFNRYFSWDFCQKCKNKNACFERVCAVRVDEEGNIFPCLNHCINVKALTVEESIHTCYSKIDKAKMTRNLSEIFSLEDVLKPGRKDDLL